MVKSKPKEVTPHGTLHLVKWVRMRTTQGVKGRWITDTWTNPKRSVQSSPTKSPTKQPSEDLMHTFSGDFNCGYEDQVEVNPMRLPQGRRRRRKKRM
ncbi:hypothetical protein P692DRAFT_20647824, partial [Suillus brevipes Sb2]